MILFPTVEEALELHHYLVERFGGAHGVRDVGLLESALYRPQTGYYEDISHMAAALMESLMINHPFLDGNKRVAFFLTDIFLRMNGYKIIIAPKAGHRFLVSTIVASTNRFDAIHRWLKQHTRKMR